MVVCSRHFFTPLCLPSIVYGIGLLVLSEVCIMYEDRVPILLSMHFSKWQRKISMAMQVFVYLFLLLETLSCHAVDGKSCTRMLVMMNWMFQLSIDCSFVPKRKQYKYYEDCSHSHWRECSCTCVRSTQQLKKKRMKIQNLTLEIECPIIFSKPSGTKGVKEV